MLYCCAATLFEDLCAQSTKHIVVTFIYILNLLLLLLPSSSLLLCMCICIYVYFCLWVVYVTVHVGRSQDNLE